MSDERRGGSGGFGAMFVLLIFVGAIVKFWVWIAVAFGAAVMFGLLLSAAFYAARRFDAREDARMAIAARADQQHRGCSPATTAVSTASTYQRKSIEPVPVTRDRRNATRPLSSQRKLNDRYRRSCPRDHKHYEIAEFTPTRP